MSDNVIKLPGRSPVLVGQAVIYRTMSNSTPGLWHYTFIQITEGLSTAPLAEPLVKCTCKGWQFNQSCWHIDAALSQFAEDAAK